MTFLPIADRELRVAARRGVTYWSRVIAAALAMLVASGMITILTVSKGTIGLAPGMVLFSVLKWITFVCVCLAGVFLTSDCLSEEKREGTLGLLFLTDLRGYDVVFGKLLAGSLRAAYGLVAVFPVMALPLLMGGVSADEFWRMMLILGNTLFFSVAAGVLVSSISREPLKAMNGTLLVCVLFVGVLPLIDWTLAGWNPVNFTPLFSLVSPGYGFYTSGPIAPRTFWTNLALPHASAWLFLALASLCAPRAWQEKSVTTAAAQNSFGHRWRFGASGRRVALRLRLLAINPVLWLAGRDRWLGRVLWAVLGLAFALLATLVYLDVGRQYVVTTGQSVNGLLTLALFVWMASQASRFFVEARRNGALELMLVSPLTVRQIVGAQGRALWRLFFWPVLVVVAMKVAMRVVQILEFQRIMAASAAKVAAATASGTVPTAVNWNRDWFYAQIISLITSVLNFSSDLFAVAWFGMWMGLTTKKTNLAVIKTIVFVLVLPWLALWFGQGMMMAAGVFSTVTSGQRFLLWVPTVIVGGLNLAKGVVFIVWSRRKLLANFRAEVSQETGHMVAPPAEPPPVIAG